MLVALTFLSLAVGCELEEPRRPVFQPTASPTPVYPSAPIDSGINDEPCEVTLNTNSVNHDFVFFAAVAKMPSLQIINFES